MKQLTQSNLELVGLALADAAEYRAPERNFCCAGGDICVDHGNDQALTDRYNALRASLAEAPPQRQDIQIRFGDGVESDTIAELLQRVVGWTVTLTLVDIQGRDPVDAWLRFADDEDEEAESEANTFRDGDGFRVEWYLTSVGQVSSRWFPTYAEASAWLEGEGFRDFSTEGATGKEVEVEGAVTNVERAGLYLKRRSDRFGGNPYVGFYTWTSVQAITIH